MKYTSPISHNALAQHYQSRLDTLIEHGDVKPFFLWHMLVLFGLPLSALLVLHHDGSKFIRRAVFALILGVAYDLIENRRSQLGANGYMLGALTTYWVIWCAALLIFNDVEKKFKRIERRAAPANVGPEDSGFIDMDKDGDVDGCDAPTSASDGGSTPTVNRKPGDDSTKRQGSEELKSRREVLVWQAYPRSFLHRLNWAFDLLSNMRGPQWNWRVSTMGPLPASVNAQLNPGKRDTSRELSDSELLDARTRLKVAFGCFVKSYLLLDLVKVLMMRDPYFIGMASPDIPPPFPFDYLSAIPSGVTLYRHMLTGYGVYIALCFGTSFGPPIFLGLSVAFPTFARAITSVPLDAPWLYADTFGPFFKSALEHGLAGCWGRWWHQLFRVGFTNAGRWILSLLPQRLATNNNIRRAVITFAAFSLSGLLHAFGSHTQLGDTKPFGPFIFFILQAVGITIEDTFKRVILPTLLPYKLPRWLRWTGNALFVYFWLTTTGGYAADDFAKGGMWTTEPIPVSPIRGLDLGVKGEGWWCWKEPWFRRIRRERWWESGLQVL